MLLGKQARVHAGEWRDHEGGGGGGPSVGKLRSDWTQEAKTESGTIFPAGLSLTMQWVSDPKTASRVHGPDKSQTLRRGQAAGAGGVTGGRGGADYKGRCTLGWKRSCRRTSFSMYTHRVIRE